MRSSMGSSVVRQKNCVKTAMYILNHNGVSRQELAMALGFSMPTVFQNVSDLIEAGLVCENGEYGSTGRKKSEDSVHSGRRPLRGGHRDYRPPCEDDSYGHEPEAVGYRAEALLL